MQMSKFQRIIWSINGVLILIVFLLIGALVIKELFEGVYRYDPPELIVGEELQKAKEKGLILQGLEYPSPIEVYRSPWLILPVEVKTYENPKEFHKVTRESFGLASTNYYNDSYSNTVNIIFLYGNLEPVHTLLDKKAFIAVFHYPSKNHYNYGDYEESSDTIARHITYQISFEDTNKDGLLDANDLSDLYISDFDGKNLKQITEDVNVLSHHFMDADHILIRYTKRTEEADEHKREYFARYTVSENKLADLESLHTSFDNLEKMLFR